MTTDKTIDTTRQAVRHLIVCDTQFAWNGSTTLKLQEMMDLQARGWIAEGEDNLEFNLTEAGEEVVARALEHGAPATLATAKHGGCVQLGGGLPPLPEYAARDVMSGWPLFSAEQMQDYARAALSAQPSPSDMGNELALLNRYDEAGAAFQDALSNDRCSDARKVELRRALTAARDEVAAALAARQPVGEPVAYKFQDRTADGCWTDQYWHKLPPWEHRNPIPLYASPPAQAEDLGQSIPSELAPVAAALKRFDECAEDCGSDGSDGCDIGRAWFDALTTMGLLKRTQRS
ncbi:hypothetical protein, partial [Stenotrophomonas indicatrix]|uniref:hypothetical protein n=1 Tax=Stenotrophomonas indicatrix TaxID=2045451 RepID=UPI0028AAAF90